MGGCVSGTKATSPKRGFKVEESVGSTYSVSTAECSPKDPLKLDEKEDDIPSSTLSPPSASMQQSVLSSPQKLPGCLEPILDEKIPETVPTLKKDVEEPLHELKVGSSFIVTDTPDVIEVPIQRIELENENNHKVKDELQFFETVEALIEEELRSLSNLPMAGLGAGNMPKSGMPQDPACPDTQDTITKAAEVLRQPIQVQPAQSSSSGRMPQVLLPSGDPLCKISPSGNHKLLMLSDPVCNSSPDSRDELPDDMDNVRYGLISRNSSDLTLADPDTSELDNDNNPLDEDRDDVTLLRRQRPHDVNRHDQRFFDESTPSASSNSGPLHGHSQRNDNTDAVPSLMSPVRELPPRIATNNFAELETMSSPSMRAKQEVQILRRQVTAPGASRMQAMNTLETVLTEGRQLLTDRALEYLIAGRNENIPKLPLKLDCEKTKWGKEWVKKPQLSLGTCQICFEEVMVMKKPCGNMSCAGFFCPDCISQTAISMIDASLYACPYLKCPECRHRVPTIVWQPLVPEENWEKYCTNARSLLNFRCPDCDEVGSLLQDRSDESPPSVQISVEEHASWVRWGTDITNTNLVDTIVNIVKKKVGTDVMSKQLSEDRPGDAHILSPSPGAHRHFYYLLSMVEDVERRCSLLLQWLRRFSYFKTPCCDAKMCFKCKTQGWHPGRSCEERMRKSLGSGSAVQWCPKCGVPTVKSEGCDHIVCCCGASWTWMRSSLLYSAIHGLEDHLLDALRQQPAVMEVTIDDPHELEEMKRSTDSWRIAHDFRDVPAGAELLRAKSTSCEGLTNIAYLTPPCKLWFRPRADITDEEEEEEDEEEGSRAIAYAAIAGSVGCLKLLIEHGYDPNHTSYRHSHTPLCAMVAEKARRWGGDSEPTVEMKISTSEILIEAKADINLVTNYGETPLTLALQEQSCPPEFLDWILNKSDLQRVPGDGVFHSLLQQQPEYPEEEEQPSPLSCNEADMFENRLADLVIKLAEKNADINQTATCGETPLMVSCERGLYSIAERLIEKKASVEPPSLTQHSYGMGSSSSGNNSIHLITNYEPRSGSSDSKNGTSGSQVDHMLLPDGTRSGHTRPSASKDSNLHGHTPRTPPSESSRGYGSWPMHVEGPLESALRANNPHRPMNYNNKIRERLVSLLLQHGASASRLGVLNHAVSQSGVPLSCIDMLLEHKAEINIMDGVHTLPLFAALEVGHTHMANLLLERKAEINLFDSRIRNLFHVIATGEESDLPWDTTNVPDVPEFFLNSRDASGHTPLGIALRNGDVNVTLWLLSLKADPNEDVLDTFTDNQPIMPLAFAIRQRSSADLCKTLLTAGSVPSEELLSDVCARCDEFALNLMQAWPLADISQESKVSLLLEISLFVGDKKEDVMRLLLDSNVKPETEMFLLVIKNPTKNTNSCLRLLLDYGVEVNEECTFEAIARGHANLTLQIFQRLTPHSMTLFDIVRSEKLTEKDQIRLVEAALEICDVSLRDTDGNLSCVYAFERRRYDVGQLLVDKKNIDLYNLICQFQEKRQEESKLRKKYTQQCGTATNSSGQNVAYLTNEASLTLQGCRFQAHAHMSWILLFLCSMVSAYIFPKEMEHYAVFEKFSKATYWWEKPSYVSNEITGLIPKHAFERVFRSRYWHIIADLFYSPKFRNALRTFDLLNVTVHAANFIQALRMRMTQTTWVQVLNSRGPHGEEQLATWLRRILELESHPDIKKIIAEVRDVQTELKVFEAQITCIQNC